MKKQTIISSLTKIKNDLIFYLTTHLYNKKFIARIMFLLSGIIATFWFLSRVIPKPSRAYYPCVQAAAPVMAGFVIYLLSITSSVVVFNRLKASLSKGRYKIAFVLGFLLIVLLGVSFLSFNPSLKATPYAGQDDFVPNVPMGVAQGVKPGRVVWVWDQQATRKQSTQTTNNNGVLDQGDDLWFMDKNTNQDFVDYMFSKSVQRLTGEATDQQSWDALFRYFNNKKGVGNRGYEEDEIILIKTNHGSAWGNERFDQNFAFNDKAWNAGYTETGPQLVLSVLRHLVNRVGVPQENIYLGDPMKNIYKEYYDKWHAEFPHVKYLGNDLLVGNIPNLVSLGRTPVERTSEDVLFFSDMSDISSAPHMHKLYTVFEKADYLINLTAMKPHDVAGITLTAKNHFGSHASQTAAHLHGVLVDGRHTYGQYRVLVDMMAHKLLGGNTLLFVVDGMWSSENTELSLPVRWTMHPFNNDYPSSLFVSQDQVALESVCYDFLRTEYSVGNYAKNNPNMKATDDYLHQAADEANWPAGLVYNPDGRGKIGSLGVHEHWNNATDKKYSRNLGTGNGIELIQVLVDNHIPLPTAPIPNQVITQTGMDTVVVEDVTLLFYDADDDPLSFSVESDDARVTSQLEGNQLVIILNNAFDEEEFARVTLTANDGKASNSLEFKVSSAPLSVNVQPDQQFQFKVNLYPNPVRDHLTLKINKSGNYTIGLINTLGQFQWEKSFSGGENRMDLSGLRSGIYQVVIYENNQIVFQSAIIKE